MRLLKRLQDNGRPSAKEQESVVKVLEPEVRVPPPVVQRILPQYYEVKEKIHRRLIDRLDLVRLDTIAKDVLHAQVVEEHDGQHRLTGLPGGVVGFARPAVEVDVAQESGGQRVVEPAVDGCGGGVKALRPEVLIHELHELHQPALAGRLLLEHVLADSLRGPIGRSGGVGRVLPVLRTAFPADRTAAVSCPSPSRAGIPAYQNAASREP